MSSYMKLRLERNKDKTGAEMQDLKPIETKKASNQSQRDPGLVKRWAGEWSQEPLRKDVAQGQK